MGSLQGHSLGVSAAERHMGTREGRMYTVPRILLEWLSLFKLEYCRLIVGSDRKIMSRGTVLHGFSVFE